MSDSTKYGKTLPEFKLSENFTNEFEYLVSLIKQKSTEKYGKNPEKEIQERINKEIYFIKKYGYERFFLFHYELTNWMDENDIFYFYRGNACSSLINYILGITDVEPLKNNFIPELFLLPHNSLFPYPHYFIEIEKKSARTLYNYFVEKYGNEHIGRIEAGKDGKSIDTSAFVITNKPLIDYIETKKMKSINICRTDMLHLKDFGLPCLDILENDLLSKIHKKERKIRKKFDSNFEIKKITLDDKMTLDLFKSGNTKKITMFDTKARRTELKNLGIVNFETLVFINATCRPPLWFNKLKNDYEDLFNVFSEYIKETFFIPIYKEQCIQIIQNMKSCQIEDAINTSRKLVTLKPDYLISEKEYIMNKATDNKDKEKVSDQFDCLLPFNRQGISKAHFFVTTKLAWYLAYMKSHYNI